MLNITDLKVELDSDSGLVKAIDGLALAIQRGQTFALVGRSEERRVGKECCR